MVKLVSYIIFSLLISTNIFSQDYKKVRVFFNDRAQIKQMAQAGIDLDHVGFTKEKYIDLFIDQHDVDKLNKLGMNYEVLIESWKEFYKKEIEAERHLTKNIQAASEYNVENFEFGSMGGFYTLSEIEAELDSMHALFPSLITEKDSIGCTIEGRPIYMVKISDNPDNDEDEPEVLYTALHHAREPESMMQLMYYMNYLLENYGKDEAITYLLDNRELYFIPVVNPDGYEYNHQIQPDGGGMWRKNRRENEDQSMGVDLNRNYGPQEYWNAPNGGSSTVGKDEVYRGTAPFSEPETMAIRDFLANHNIRVALNYHTHSNLLIYPYGALSRETPDSLIFREYSHDMTVFNGYATGTDMQTVGYSTRGNSDDYFYDGDTVANHGKIFAMTPEVGSSSDGVGGNGFWPRVERIIPLAEENIYPNLYYAWVAGEYVGFGDLNLGRRFFNGGDTINISPVVKNKGLEDASNINIELSSGDEFVQILNGTDTIHEIHAREEISAALFSFTLLPGVPLGKEIQLVLTSKSGEVEMSSDAISFIAGTPAFVFIDTTNDITNYWETNTNINGNDWTETNSDYFSPPTSFTDSKGGDYSNSVNTSMTLKDPVYLPELSNPKLIFYTKFDIEDDWDYGQVLLSTNDGESWNALQGKYMNPSSGQFQPNGEYVYDGGQQQWVREEIDLSAYEEDSVKILFSLKSDTYVTRDGWYIDDIGITVDNDILSAGDKGIIREYKLEQNYPNPFNPVTSMQYAMGNRRFVSLKVYDVLGNEVATLVNEEKAPGNYKVTFDASGLASGIYFYQLRAGNFIDSKKMILLR